MIDLRRPFAIGWKEPSRDVAASLINGLAAGWPSGKARTLDADMLDEGNVGPLLAKLSAASRGRFLKLASTWGVKGLDAQLAEITKTAFATLADVKAKDADRLGRGAADHRVPARQRRGREGHC